MDGGRHPSLASNGPDWSSCSTNISPVAEEEMCADVDEPPDPSGAQRQLAPTQFQKTSIHKQTGDRHSSLLTRALLSQSDEDAVSHAPPSIMSRQRRRSMTSNVSQASTADLTSDTGLTSPSRENTPSPPLPEVQALCIQDAPVQIAKFGQLQVSTTEDSAEYTPRKKSITFACFAKPERDPSESKACRPQKLPTMSADAKLEPPRKACIRFACPARPSSGSDGSSRPENEKSASAAVRWHRSPPPPVFRQVFKEDQHPVTNGAPQLQTLPQPRPDDSTYDEPKEDDWIREENLSPKRRITIRDTLVKENHIRRLAQEAEEEEVEEGDEEANVDNEEDGDEDDEGVDEDEDEDDEDEDEDEDEEETEYGSVEADDGYHTDEETGFADSEEDEEDGLHLWNNGIQLTVDPSPGGVGLLRRLSATDHHSDSSTGVGRSENTGKRCKARRIANRAPSPELPDSTDFVCGTFDEDRPMEEAYLTRRAALKAQKMHLIPQDIDPSFPTSDIEDGDGEELFNPVHHESEDELWRMDDVHADKDRMGRKKVKGASPMRYHSPPPKVRGRSPKPFDKHSPRRMRSPGPRRFPFIGASPTNGVHVKFGGLAPCAGLPQTKSLPRPAVMLTLVRNGKKPKVPTSDNHVRGAIDIVKGLEHKRQRRKEKYFQKYCSRARKGQMAERKAMPGQGATKMRELGLLMAGKTDRGNYVLSI